MANVNVNEVKLCPNKDCEVVLPNPVPEKCISCGSLLRSPDNKYFGTPDYLTMQLSDHLSRAKEPYAVLVDVEEGAEKPDKKIVEEELRKMSVASNDIKSHYMAWLKVMPKNDMVASFRDVKSILQHMIMSNTDLDSYRILIQFAKDIGELGKTLEDYIKAEGQIANFEHLMIPVDVPKTQPEEEEPTT